VTGASGSGAIDWDAVAEAARASTDPGSLDLSEEEREGYAADVREARAAVRSVGGVEFDVPRTVEVHNRHHWIDANVNTFSRVMRPLEEHTDVALPGVSRVLNTGTMSFMLAFLARNVLGQYDPLLLAEGDDNDHALYFVRPNIQKVAATLDVEYERFRRWIAFHEVTHAAEFGAAPWLSDHLEGQMEEGIKALSDGHLDRDAFRELDAAMTVVEGYAELLMDHAFDDEYADLRAKLDARRKGRGPVAKFVRRALGLGVKRRQYERGKAFFERVAEVRGVEAANAVWNSPEQLPSDAELDDPDAWVRRVDP
jgi:uncharacterized protein (DUF2342 family)